MHLKHTAICFIPRIILHLHRFAVTGLFDCNGDSIDTTNKLLTYDQHQTCYCVYTLCPKKRPQLFSYVKSLFADLIVIPQCD